MVCAVLANINRDPERHPQPYRPQDFVPRYGSEKAQTVEEQLTLVELWNAALGGTDERPREGG